MSDKNKDYEKGFKDGKNQANKELNEKIKKVSDGVQRFKDDIDKEYKKDGGMRKG